MAKKKTDAGILVGGDSISALRYADDMVFLSNSAELLEIILLAQKTHKRLTFFSKKTNNIHRHNTMSAKNYDDDDIENARNFEYIASMI